MASFVPRYAQAFAAVIEQRRLDAVNVLVQVKSIAELVAANSQLRAAWESPSIDEKGKLALLDQIAAREGLIREVRNFIAVLIDRRRIGSIVEIAQQLQKEIDERLGLADAEIVTARELDASEKQALESRIAESTGKTVRAAYRQDKSLLGGALIKVGSTIYDGSVRGQLQRLKEQLTAS